MPPVYVKGGIWSNVEDQVLKAAISKYGLNQWARVASLLPKKTAKQAKARWNEWINPTINKTDWKREEDEKLLKLAKALPNQWRSIAPIIGRTATQCVERYEKLLEAVHTDELEDEEEENLKLIGPGAEVLPSQGTSHLEELSIDAETRPSKPDEDNMEDEEKEMLSEAKARLANTMGKKAKRKMRERMLEETRRIALLQKRRELKAAGISTSLESKNKKRRLEFDYNADIPFEHAVPEGPYDISEENVNNENEKISFLKNASKQGIQLLESRREMASHKGEKPMPKKASKGTSSIASEEILYDRATTTRGMLNLPPPTNDENVNPTIHLEKKVDIDDRIADMSKELLKSKNQTSSLLADESLTHSRKKPEHKNKATSNASVDLREIFVELKANLPAPKSTKANFITDISYNFDASTDGKATKGGGNEESGTPIVENPIIGDGDGRLSGSIRLAGSINSLQLSSLDSIIMKEAERLSNGSSVEINKSKTEDNNIEDNIEYISIAKSQVKKELEERSPMVDFAAPTKVVHSTEEIAKAISQIHASNIEKVHELENLYLESYDSRKTCSKRLQALFSELSDENHNLNLAKVCMEEEDKAAKKYLDHLALRIDRFRKAQLQLE